jgi:hypothetical protein
LGGTLRLSPEELSPEEEVEGLAERGGSAPGVSVTFMLMSMSRFCAPAGARGIRDEP